MGAIFGAILAVAVLSSGDMTVTDLLQVRTYAEEAYLQYSLGNGPAAAGAVALPPLLILGTLIGFGATWLLRADPARLVSAASSSRTWRLGSWRIPIGILLVVGVGNFVALPLYALVWRAGRVGGIAASGRVPHWSFRGLTGTLKLSWQDAAGPLFSSLWLSASSALLAVTLAWTLAWFGRRLRIWRWIAAASVAITLAVPGPVAGMALVYAYRNFPRLAFGINLTLGVDQDVFEWAHRFRFSMYDSPMMVIVAGMTRTFPYALLVLWPAVQTIPGEILDAGAIDGLKGWGLVRRVGFPSTMGAIVASWAIVFVLAFGELPATNLVTPPGLNPLSVAIWGLLHTGVESHLAGVVLIMLAVVGLAGLLASLAFSRIYAQPRN